jgi:hypothetical protein
MAKLIVDIPAEKMQSFKQFMQKLGLDWNSTQSDEVERPAKRKLRTKALKRFSQPFLLFDWEFFSNELEFE